VPLSHLAMSQSAHQLAILRVVQAGVYDLPTNTDEPHLRLCLGCLSGALWAISSMDASSRGAFLRHIRIEYRDFLVQLMHFVTRAREPASMSSLDGQIRATHGDCCHGEAEDDCFHGYLKTNESTMELVVGYVFSFLDGIITGTRILAHRNPFATGGWPMSASDASPFGPQVTVTTLIDWWIKLDSAYGDIGLDRFLSMLQPTVAHVFVAQHSSFAERAIAIWSMLALKIINGTSTNSDHHRFCENIHLLGTVAAILNGGEELTQRMFGGLESSLFTAMFSMVQAAEKLGHLPIHAIGACALTFSSALRCDLPATHFTRYLQFARDQIVRESDTSNIYGIFHHDLHRSYRPRECMRAGCDARDTNENYMRRCGRCRFFVYCSYECQRAGWKAQYLPHKDSCPKFQAVLRIADYTKSVEYFVRRCKASKLSADTLGELKFIAYSADNGRQTLTADEQIRAINGTCR